MTPILSARGEQMYEPLTRLRVAATAITISSVYSSRFSALCDFACNGDLAIFATPFRRDDFSLNPANDEFTLTQHAPTTKNNVHKSITGVNNCWLNVELQKTLIRCHTRILSNTLADREFSICSFQFTCAFQPRSHGVRCDWHSQFHFHFSIKRSIFIFIPWPTVNSELWSSNCIEVRSDWTILPNSWVKGHFGLKLSFWKRTHKTYRLRYLDH